MFKHFELQLICTSANTSITHRLGMTLSIPIFFSRKESDSLLTTFFASFRFAKNWNCWKTAELRIEGNEIDSFNARTELVPIVFWSIHNWIWPPNGKNDENETSTWNDRLLNGILIENIFHPNRFLIKFFLPNSLFIFILLFLCVLLNCTLFGWGLDTWISKLSCILIEC